MFVDIKIALSKPIIPQVICFALILLMIWQVSMGIFSFYSLDKAMTERAVRVPAKRVDVNRESLGAGINRSFFGDYVPTNLNDAGVKESMLDLTLVGIMFGTTEKASHVIIRSSGGHEQPFSVGDSLPGGAVIKRITPDGVLVMRNGTLESLSLPKDALTFEPPAKPLEGSN